MKYGARGGLPRPGTRRATESRGRPASVVRLRDETGALGNSRIVGLLVALVAGLIAALVLSGSPADTAAQRLAEAFAGAWTRGDYAQMYAAVDPATRTQYSITAFADYYRNDLATATATGARVGKAKPPHNGTVEVPVLVQTSLFGDLHSSFVLPITGSGSSTRILWRRSLGFPGLLKGESLTRQTSLPPGPRCSPATRPRSPR